MTRDGRLILNLSGTETWMGTCMREIVTFLQGLARDAGALMMQYRNQPFEVYQKADNTVVTEVDLKISQMVCAAISETYPQAGLLTEETLGKMVAPRRFGFIIDELDGTYAYSQGRGGFTFQCAYYDQFHVLQIGLIYDPLKDCMVYAIKGEGVWKEYDQQIIPLSPPPVKAWETLRYAHHRTYMTPTMQRMYDRLGVCSARIIPTGGIGSKAVDFALEKVDVLIALNRKIAAWDWAPGKVILEELGYHVGYLTGQDLTINQPELDFSFGYLVCPRQHYPRFCEELQWDQRQKSVLQIAGKGAKKPNDRKNDTNVQSFFTLTIFFSK